jgi:hypothetical protein
MGRRRLLPEGLNPLCAQCRQECKQAARATVMSCPSFKANGPTPRYPSAIEKPLSGHMRPPKRGE